MTIHAKPDMAKCFPTPHFHVWVWSPGHFSWESYLRSAVSH